MSVNIYDKVTGELIQIAGNGGGSIDDINVSNKTTYSSEKIEELINNSVEVTFATDEEVEQAMQSIINSYEGRN